MRTRLLFFTLIGCLILPSVMAQSVAKDDKKMQNAKYRRSSIYTLMLDDAGLVKADTIKRSFESAPIPNKFDDHTLAIRSFRPADYPLTEAEKQTKKDNGVQSYGKGLLSNTTGGLVDTTNTKDLPQIIQKFFRTNQIPQQLIAKWFNRDENGNLNMNRIAERGQYDATEMQASIAKSSARGSALLSDAGEELIGNTFVVITRFKYVSKEEIMGAAKRGLSLLNKYGGQYGQLAAQVGSVAADVASKGYVIQANSYLYKLTWNDSISSIFYQNYWMDANSNSPERKAAFDTTSLFSLELVGVDKAWADVQSSIFSKKSEEELVRIATVKSIDAVIAKLQKEHDVFKTKTPLFDVTPLSAKIGLKEGIEKGDKYEVLEQTMNDLGKTKYVRKGVIKVDEQIWDNRYMAGEELPTDSTSNVVSIPKVDRTLFKGGSNYYPGMLIRQIK
ncbi:hypothetical protein [Williamwhitmania taraxaci]|uniref:Uncharacterized protein n=1 Tax=Williamwhitmania taraxaci TaxID=1640674 RepID=A0A1G6SAA0_9BACT|nr:hypothetical protein [Williamwhitmania taraxaci]SDD13594.1 hypothetical protein SAMN05216323_10907 [Williamwhitmania taraxaci]